MVRVGHWVGRVRCWDQDFRGLAFWDFSLRFKCTCYAPGTDSIFSATRRAALTQLTTLPEKMWSSPGAPSWT